MADDQITVLFVGGPTDGKLYTVPEPLPDLLPMPEFQVEQETAREGDAVLFSGAAKLHNYRRVRLALFDRLVQVYVSHTIPSGARQDAAVARAVFTPWFTVMWERAEMAPQAGQRISGGPETRP